MQLDNCAEEKNHIVLAYPVFLVARGTIGRFRRVLLSGERSPNNGLCSMTGMADDFSQINFKIVGHRCTWKVEV